MSASQRYLELDALRGFAVMGILLMNILAFNMPEMAYINPTVYGGSEGGDFVAWLLGFIFVDGKMRGLFSLLFGASMMLIISRAEAKGEDPATVHYTRMLWLAVFGLFHFFFIWWGDILFIYAVMGCAAYLFHKWESGRLIKWAIAILLAGTVLLSAGLGSLFSLEMAASAPDADADTIAEFREVMADFGADPALIKQEIARYGGSYWSITSHKIQEMLWAPLGSVILMLTETLPMMMIGMALYKNGFLLGDAGATRYRKWAIGGIVSGVIFYSILAAIVWSSGFDTLITFNANIAWTMPPRLIMTIGYAAAFILLIQKLRGSAFLVRVAYAGRAAFTNYLGTSIVMTLLFYGYGAGLYGQFDRAESYLFVPAVWALMLLWSKPWLTHFRYGPLEWLWRSLARMKIQPMGHSQ